MQWYLLALLLAAVGCSGVSDFVCYKCSYDKLYNTNQAWNKKECMDNPSSLGATEHVVCNSTSYCMFQEMYDIGRKEVTSFYRSCVARSTGSSCIEDWTHVTCTGFCRGNYCNRNETGEHYKIHFG